MWHPTGRKNEFKLILNKEHTVTRIGVQRVALTKHTAITIGVVLGFYFPKHGLIPYGETACDNVRSVNTRALHKIVKRCCTSAERIIPGLIHHPLYTPTIGRVFTFKRQKTPCRKYSFQVYLDV